MHTEISEKYNSKKYTISLIRFGEEKCIFPLSFECLHLAYNMSWIFWKHGPILQSGTEHVEHSEEVTRYLSLFALCPLWIHTTHCLLHPLNFPREWPAFKWWVTTRSTPPGDTLLAPCFLPREPSECTSCILNAFRDERMRFLGRGLYRVPRTGLLTPPSGRPRWVAIWHATALSSYVGTCTFQIPIQQMRQTNCTK
jgi:hypothetical protein